MKGALISYEVDISELFARANRLLQYRAPAEEPEREARAHLFAGAIEQAEQRVKASIYCATRTREPGIHNRRLDYGFRLVAPSHC